jgi:hypothetical protein
MNVKPGSDTYLTLCFRVLFQSTRHFGECLKKIVSHTDNAHGLKKITVGNVRIKYQSYIFFILLSMFHLLGEFKNHLSLFIFNKVAKYYTGLIFSRSTQDFQSTTTLKTWSLYRGQMNGKMQGRNKLGRITQEVVIWRGSLRASLTTTKLKSSFLYLHIWN